MKPLRQGRGRVPVSDDFDIDAGAARFRASDSFIKFAACRDTRRLPAVAPECFRKPVIMPFRDIVVAAFRILAEQSLDKIAVVVEDEDDRFQPKAMELADFLRRQLMRAVTGNEDEALAGRC